MSMLEELKRLLETPEGEEQFNNWLKKNEISEMIEKQYLEEQASYSSGLDDLLL